ncbi:acyl carrier protein [Georgenia muralis]
MDVSSTTLDGVIAVVVETLGIEGRELDASTPLFGAMPELDSLAVLSLATALEDRFGFEIDDEDFTGDVFETVGSLAEFVEQQRS